MDKGHRKFHYIVFFMFENFHNKKLKQKKHSKFIWVLELSDQVLLKVMYQA